MGLVSDPEARPPSGDGRGDFFAVDRRAWAHVCRFGMNAGIAYLTIARGTGGDNRTSWWSAHAIRRRTGISRSRAPEAIEALERARAVVRDPASKRGRPKYKVAPAHEIPGCEGFLPLPASPEQRQVLDQLGDAWTSVPSGSYRRSSSQFKRWGTSEPRKVADELVGLGCAIRSPDGWRYRAARHDAEAAMRPDRIWLPNALVDGAGGETPPVELVRQTGSAPTLRLLVDLYGAQKLDEDGGVHFRCVRQEYERHEVGERGPFVVWGFAPGTVGVSPDASFVVPHLTGEKGEEGRDKGLDGFLTCWRRLRDLGLVEMVAHLVYADTAEGEIFHPMALEGTGLEVEREVRRAAEAAVWRMATPEQLDWAEGRGVAALAPVARHIEGVQMLGIARLRYRPRTNRTRAFMRREAEWREAISRLRRIAEAGTGTGPLQHQGTIKV